MKREEFVVMLEREGFRYLGKEGDAEVGRITYEDGFTSDGCKGQDWELWYVYPDRAIHQYETSRSVPGWHLCPYCGNWYTDDEEEYHEDCESEVVRFD